MPVRSHVRPSGVISHIWPSGGRHLWPSGAASAVQTHARGHLVYAARGVLGVHTERGTSIVPANRVAWTPAGFTHFHRAHGDTDMRIVFLAPSLARHLPDHPAVFVPIAQVLHEDPSANTSLAELGTTIGANTRTLSRLVRDELA